MYLKDFEKSQAIWSARKALRMCKTEKEMLETAADILREIGEAMTKWKLKRQQEQKMSEVKQFFRSIMKTQVELMQIDQQLESVLTLLTRTVRPLKEVNVRSSVSNKQEDLIIKQMELLAHGENVKKDLLDKHELALNIIRRMPTPTYATILSMRYCTLNPKTLKQFTWEEVSERIGYAEAHAKRLHGEALKEAEVIYNDLKNKR